MTSIEEAKERDESFCRQPFAGRLVTLAEERGLALSPAQAELCARHVELMLEWNRRMNLTRITDEEDILFKHILDALLPGRELPSSGWALDVGAGPGFPGLSLKILHPDLQMVLLEANNKKVSFLRAVVADLELAGLNVLHGRWEDWARLDAALTAQPYGLVTMRAVRLEAVHLRRLAPLVLGEGGLFAYWTGPEDVALHSSALAKSPMTPHGEIPYSLHPSRGPRRVLLWKKRGQRIKGKG